jgi:nucleoid-associated protein YgaU
VTATRKLFVAAALVAVGVGVAKLLGEPAGASRALDSAGALLKQQFAPSQDTSLPSTPSYASGGLRLVPDFSVTNSTPTEANLPLTDTAPTLLANTKAPASERAVIDDSRAMPNRPPWNSAPGAKLRNEGPRPLAIESRSLTTLNEIPAAVSAPTIVASYNAMPDPAATAPIAPSPWSVPDDINGPRTHVVIDGDSLARLAGRYLDDPRRSGEIFEANRRVLNDSDLLPIGAELVIPDRINPGAADHRSPHSFLPRAVAIHAPATSGLVPVRPVPATPGISPRAQLSPPIPVE